ncbi:MAG: histidine kinase [Saprospiraceae bacterium]|nr:histidine kinase [Saprospiraceae bacterium]
MSASSIRSLVTAILATSAFVMSAQWRPPRLYNLGPEQGMSSWTFDITQDSTGYMYFGTDQGLVRYDGNEFELFAHQPGDSLSIGAGDVRCLLASSGGKIWVGLRLGGFNSFDPKSLQFKQYHYPLLVSNGYETVQSICEDQRYVWLGGDHYWLHRFDPATEQFESFGPEWLRSSTNAACSITDILQDRFDPNRLWMTLVYRNPAYPIPFDSRLVSFDKQSKQFVEFPCYGKALYQDSLGVVWMGSTGINRFEPESGTCIHVDYQFEMNGRMVNPLVRDIEYVRDGFLLSSAYTIGRLNSEGAPGKAIHVGEDIGIVEEIFADAGRNVWFGRTNGVSVLSSKEEKIDFYSITNYGFSGRIYPGRLAYDPVRNRIYLSDHGQNGTGKKLIAISLHSDTSSLVLEHETSLNGLAVDAQGRVLISSGGMMFALDPETGKKLDLGMCRDAGKGIPSFWNLSVSPNGWIGGVSRDRFVWFRPGESCHSIQNPQTFMTADGPQGPIFQGLFFNDHNEAIVFTNRIYAVDLATARLTPLVFEKGIQPFPDIDVNSVIQDARGHYWVSNLAMTGEFIRRGDSLILVKRYTTQDGLGCAWVHELYPDRQGRVWAFAQNGLNGIDPQTREIRQFGVREGLVDPYIDPRQVLTLKDGRIATVNGSGIIVFHPDSLWNAYTREQIPIVLKEIRIAGQRVSYSGDVNFISNLELDPGQHYLDVQFQALAYPNDYNLTYCYRVEGLSDQWIALGENKIVTLASLKPGNYVLQIKAGNPSTPSPIRSLDIHVKKPLTAKTWFILLWASAFAGLMIGIYNWRIRYIRKREAEKANYDKQITELELKALRSQMNPHFMFNSLNSIKNYILHAEPKIAAEYLSNFSHLIRMILQNSKEKTITLAEEVETLLLYIELEQIRFENKFEFSLEVDEKVEMDQVSIPPMLLQPFVENAIWHGLLHKNGIGHLRLQFALIQDQVACVIDDDGVGRAKAAELKSLSAVRYKSMGMGITLDRVELLNKMDSYGIHIDITDKTDPSGQAAGTCVTVKIPVANS